MHIIDTHTHLTSRPFVGQLDETLARSRDAGVDRWITVGCDTADSREAVEICENNDGLFAAVGVHPHEAAKAADDYIEQLKQLAENDCVKAIGETGGDYHYDFSDRPSQRRVFAEQLNLAGELRLPAIVHCREAFDDCMAILLEAKPKDLAVVFHCFSGNVAQAEKVIDMGGYISFAGTVTFKNAAELQLIAQNAPLDRIMIETDCPYLSPEPMRKIKPNSPALLVHTAERIAELRGLDIEEIAQATGNNSRCFFKLD